MVVHKDIQFLTPFKVHDTLSIIHHSEPLKKTVLFLIITTLMNTIYWAPNMCSLGEGGNILFLTISGMRKPRLRDLSDLSTFSELEEEPGLKQGSPTLDPILSPWGLCSANGMGSRRLCGKNMVWAVRGAHTVYRMTELLLGCKNNESKPPSLSWSSQSKVHQNLV